MRLRWDCGPWRLLLGMQWCIALDRQERIQLRKSLPHQSVAIASFKGMTWLGFHEDEAQERLYSGALLMGQLYPNSIVCMPLGHELFWFCVLQGAQPLVSVDEVLEARSVQKHLSRYQAMFPSYLVLQFDPPTNSEARGETPVRRESLEDLGRLDHEKEHAKEHEKEHEATTTNSLAQVLNEWASAGGSKDVASALLQCRVQSPRLLKRQRRAWSALFMVLVLLTYLCMEWMDVQLNLKREIQAQVTHALQSSRLAQQEELSAAKALESLQRLQSLRKVELERYLFIADPLEMWQMFNALRRSIPLSASGIQPKAIHCEPKACVVDWVLNGSWHSNAQAWSRPKDGAQDPKNFMMDARRSRSSNALSEPFVWDRPLNAQGESSSTVELHLHQKALGSLPIISPEELVLYMNLGLKKQWPNLSLTPMKALRFDKLSGGEGGQESNSKTTRLNPQSSIEDPPTLSFGVHQGEWQISWQGDAALLRGEAFMSAFKDHPLTLESIIYSYRQGLAMKGRFQVVSQDGPLGISELKAQEVSPKGPAVRSDRGIEQGLDQGIDQRSEESQDAPSRSFLKKESSGPPP